METNTPQQSSQTRTKIGVYFLAAKEDQEDCQAVKKHLTPVVRNSKIPIEIYSDFDIPAGEDTNAYKQKLYEADIVLAFISADYINDDDIYYRTQKVIEKYNKNETIMLPILVRNCLWKSTPFVNLPLLPKNIQPLNNKQFWNSEDDALTSVVKDINESIRSFSYESPVEEPSVVETKSDSDQPSVQPSITTNPEQKTEQVEAIKQPIKEPQSKILQTHNTTRLDVDWRSSYYRNVILKRGLAFVLDQFLVLLPAYGLPFFILGMVMADSTEAELNAGVDQLILPAIIFYFIVCAFLESSKWRGTPGKRILKLQITDKEGNPISFIRAFFRNIARWIVGYLYFLSFGVLIIVQYFTFKKSKKLFHDWASNTVIGEKLP